ncbi:multidrug efflux permease [Acidilobus saccharovorans 345-15]|uniref:Multidrug efflux permease n=1 Tax=Acidilobus saccharovorans (strain DSM 16705 / JCM 18335 / VKM B-2471 / 345-15) TaxID=666510 RepID=D9Q0R3_ACIS3|nr:MFS transporter [Acidilobus saccharovorans]ADL18901.1 multidrug efflux permease [Acidilobus saccharovorans 345-15]
MKAAKGSGDSFAVIAAIVILVTFGARASNNMIATTLPLLVKRLFNFNGLAVGLIATAFMGSTFVSSTFINARLPAVSRRRFFVAAAIAYAALFPLYAFSSPLTVWVLAVAAGMALGPIMPNIMTSAGSVRDLKARERLLTIYTLALSTSLLVGPAIDSVIVKYVGLKASFIFFEPIAALVAVMAPLVRFPEEGHPSKGSTRPSVTSILANNGFIAASLNNLTYSVPFAFITSFAGLYAEYRFHVSDSIALLLYSLFYTTSFLGRLVLAIRPPYNVVRLMILSSSLTLLGLIAAWASPTLLVYMAALLLLGIPHGLTYTLSVISISRTFEPRSLNAANSYFFSIMMIIGSGLPAALGAIVTAAGYQTTILSIVPIVAVIFGATMFFARRASAVLVRPPMIAEGP